MADDQQMEQVQQEDGTDEPMETEERTESYDKFLGMGFPEKVAAALDKFLVSGVLKDEELDDRAMEALKEFDETSAVGVLKQFGESDLSHVQNKSAFLCGVIKTYRQKSRMKQAPVAPGSENKGPDEKKINEILERTGYTLDITHGQRKYGGPPPNWEGGPPPPSLQSQVFVGKIPRDVFEDTLIPLFEKCGTIYDLRLMVDPLRQFINRGYAFVTYSDKEGAKEAVKQLDGHSIKDGTKMSVCISVPNSRLFVGSIPKSKTKEEIKEEFEGHASGLVEVIIYLSSEDKTKNRGFAFLDYDSHKSASLARRKMSSGRFKVWGNITPTVDWADPVVEPDEDTMSKVKVAYIRNLTPEATEEKIKTQFEQYGKVEKLKKIKDYCFVHYEEREGAIKAIEEMNESEFEGSNIEVSLAKPAVDNQKKKNRQNRGGFMGPGGGPRGRGGARGRGGYGGYGDFGGYGGGFGYGGGYDEYYGGYGGGYGGYGGGYDDYEGYYGGFDGGYGGGYGGPRGRGGPRGGGPMRGRGGPRGGPRGGGPMRGRGGPRGGQRGGQRGGRGGRGGNMGGKRKFEGGQQMDTKRRNTQGGQWGAQPIAQQPLNQGYGGYDYNSYGGDSWSSDNYSGWN